jgi:hypothetical protein
MADETPYAPDSLFTYQPRKNQGGFKWNEASSARNIRTRTGRMGYFDSDWHGLSGDIVDTISGKVENLKGHLTKKGEGWGKMGQAQVETAVAGFQEFGLTNMREGYADRKLKEAEASRAEGLAETQGMDVPNTTVTTVGQAQANLDRRIQGFSAAKKKIRAANEAVDDSQGTSFSYNDTGYEKLNPNIDNYYAQFDAQIAQAQQLYAEDHGYESWDAVEDGFGMFSSTSREVTRGVTNARGLPVYERGPDGRRQQAMETVTVEEQNTRAHKQDIMNFILSDMTGISADELTYIATAEIGHGSEKEGYLNERRSGEAQNIGTDGIAAMRDTFGKIFYGSANASDKAAAATDAFRVEAAKEAKTNAMTSQARMKEASENSTADAVMELNAGIRTAEQEYESTKYRLLSGGIGGKRKVKDVNFKSTRPE